MNTLSEIVNLFADPTESLTNGFLKFKLLAGNIQNKELLDWLNKELNGYQYEKELPEYRKTKGLPIASFTNGLIIQNNEKIPIWYIDKDLRKFISEVAIYDNIALVEEHAKKPRETIKYSLSGEISAFILAEMKKINPTAQGFTIFDAHIMVDSKIYKDIESTVRNTAFDLALSLQGELGYEVEFEEIIKNKDKSNQIINHILEQKNFINNGDGNLINTGDKNKINQTVTINKGDFEQLHHALRQTGINEEDISELKEILDNDNTDFDNKQFGEKTKGWMQKMIAKFWDAGEQIGYGAIGSIIATALNLYFGF